MTDEKLTLYIGNRTYSSWSLRGWLPLKLAGASFEEVLLKLAGPDAPADAPERKAIQGISPSGRVPLLKHGELFVWDSLAICEYISELYPLANLWPEERRTRAVARSVSSEMHSGFMSLRTEMSMNVVRDPFKLEPSAGTASDITQIKKIWHECRKNFGQAGPFLFGKLTIADIMFAPVVTRFQTYGVEVNEEEAAYMKSVIDLPAMQEWVRAAKAETWRIAAYEKIGKN